MTTPVITMTLKEAEAMEAEMAALQASNTKLSNELATAKTAGENAPTEKVAGALADVMVERKMVSSDMLAATRANLTKEGGLVSYFKRACDLYIQAEAGRKEAVARLREIPARLGKVASEEKAEPKGATSALKLASDRFAQRVLATR